MLVGTRALLGEGWNCPPLNVLVDMTVATTGVSVQQMRGRSLRLDPADPEKVASNWDVVCVAPDLTRGSADYERFVRKHLHLFAPAEDGEVEAGPSHVHPELGPFAPPPTDRFHALNAELVRARRRPRRRPRAVADRHALPRRGAPHPPGAHRVVRDPAPPPTGARPRPPRSLSQRVPVASGLGGAAAFGALGSRRARSRCSAGRARAGRAGLGRACACARRKKRMPLVLPLDAAARAVDDAYRELGEMTDEAAASLRIEPRASGYLRCELSAASPEEGERFAAALDELVSIVRRAALPRLAPARRPAARRERHCSGAC